MKHEHEAANASEPLLLAKNLGIGVRQGDGQKDIIRDASFHLDRGEILGVIGESGAGKSTLGLACAGFTNSGCEISAGTIMFAGRDLSLVSPAELRAIRGVRISYVAQSAAAYFNPAHRILNQVIEPAIVHGIQSRDEAVQNAERLFHELSLPDVKALGRRYPHQVSGGQLQRAMIAMALICNPDLVIFDEPTTALDMTTQVDVVAAIRRVVRSHGTAAIYISHDLALVTQVANRIIVMRDGEILEEGPVENIIVTPQHEYTKLLVAARIPKKLKNEEPDGTKVGLAVEKLSAAYGKVLIVKDVAFDVPEGTTLAVIGESGSGKSTLAMAVAGIVPPAFGTVAFRGEQLAPRFQDRKSSELRSIQTIFQMPDTSLNPKHTVGESIGRPLKFYFGMSGSKRRERVRELLGMIELSPEMAARKVGSLSGGQKQRVCIARALAAEPDLIICDEVTSALDPLVAEGIIALLKDLQRRLSLSYLFITHNFASVEGLADRVMVIKDGKIVDRGTTDEIFTSSRHPYTTTLIKAVPRMELDWLDGVLEGKPDEVLLGDDLPLG